MNTWLVAQPFSQSLHSVLVERLSDASVTRVDIVTAWAKRSGLTLIDKPLKAFAQRGGTTTTIVGISAGGATQQGLQLVMETSRKSYVFHDPTGRTFHPKYYVLRSISSALVVVGSNNLTLGGMSNNYEVAACFDLDLATDQDRQFLAAIDSLTDRLVSMSSTCLPLTPALLSALMADRRYRIGDEDHPAADSPRDASSDSSPPNSANDPLFRAPAGATYGPGSVGIRPPRPLGGPFVPGPPPSVVRPERRWYKKLSAADAQHPSGRQTNPTGHLTLVQAAHPIQQATWFRQDLFGGQRWHRLAGNREETEIAFEVLVGQRRLVNQVLLVRYTPSFESGQGNRTTVIHWGDALGSIMHAQNYAGHYVTIERVSRGEFKLTIAPMPTGEFIG